MCIVEDFIFCQVKQWITFNEPWIISILGYGDGVFPPGITGSGTNSYTVSHNLILAHAMAYRMYKSEFEVESLNMDDDDDIDDDEYDDEYASSGK